MITVPITLKLPGHPVGRGSMKCIGQVGPVKHKLKESEPVGARKWRRELTALAKQVQQQADPHQPIGVRCVFTVERPVSHFGSGRNRPRLAKRAPMRPTTKGTHDVDKQLRLVLDVLEAAGVLVNDAQVVETTASKTYPVPTVVELTGPTPPPWAYLWLPHLGEQTRPVPVPDALAKPGARIFIYPLDDQED